MATDLACPICEMPLPSFQAGVCYPCIGPIRTGTISPSLRRLISVAGFDTVNYTAKELQPFQDLYDAIRAEGAAEAVEKVAQKYDCVIMRDGKTRLGDAIREIGSK